MSKFLRLSIVALILMGLMVGSAFAGTIYVNSGSSTGGANVATVSLETLGGNRTLLVQSGASTNADSVNNAPIGFSFTQNVTSSNLLQVTFSGAAFNGDVLNVCSANETTTAGAAAPNAFIQIGTGSPAANINTYNFQLTGVPAAGINAYSAKMYITYGACNYIGNTGNIVPIQMQTASGTGYATVTGALLTSGGVVLDSASAAGNIAKIVVEYKTTIAAGNHTVDYLSAPNNGTLLLGAANGLTPVGFAGVNGVDMNRSVNTLTVNNNAAANTYGAQNAGLTALQSITLTDTQNWQGISKVYLAPGGFNGVCTDAKTSAGGANVVGSGAPSGSVSLALATGSFNGSAGSNWATCIVGNGTSTLLPRTITASSLITVSGTGANTQAATVGTIDTWNMNAYQAIVPWVVLSSAAPTYCVINNGTTAPASAGITVSVMSSEGSITGLSNLSLGSVNAGQTQLVTLNASGITTANGGTSPLQTLSTMGANSRYSLQLTVAASSSGVTMNCNQTDPVSGAKRPVPVLVNTANSAAYYTQ